MGTLYLVRHGQASFGADDYDVLSELGERQCRRLGEYLSARGVRFHGVVRGTLRRQAQSLAAIAQGYGELPAATVWRGLDEYDAQAVVRAIHPAPLACIASDDDRRRHFRLLREGLAAWTQGRLAPPGMPNYAAFVAGIVEVLDHVREHHAGQVLAVTSGGPIGSAVAQALGAPPAAAIELNLRLRNSAVSELVFNARGYTLHSFNHLPHLDAPEYAQWVTYA